jgi:hypothetical protein
MRVQGGVTDLVKSVTCQVVADRPCHVASRPRTSASTDLQLGIPFYRYCLLESVTVKSTRERIQVGTGQPPPRSTGQQPLHTTYSCQVHPWGDTYFGGITNFLIIS